MLRPLYGLAVDLTPEAVIGPAPRMPPLPAVLVGTALPVLGAVPPSAAASPTLRPRRLPESRSEPARLVAAAVAFGAVAMTLLMAATRSDPTPAIAAQTASAGNAAAASRPIMAVAAPSAAEPAAPAPKPIVKSNSSAPVQNHRPNDPWKSRSEPTDADLTVTLERFREGIR